MKILWANTHSLLDTSSGASMSVRQILHSLYDTGCQLKVLSATVFDSPNGTKLLDPYRAEIDRLGPNSIVNLEDGPIIHETVITRHNDRYEIRSDELLKWAALYENALEKFNPDVLFFYNGSIAHFIPAEAKRRKIPTVKYLVSNTYHGTRWRRDIDYFCTDTAATQNFYASTSQMNVEVIGKFIPPSRHLHKQNFNEQKFITFINPSLVKGVGITVLLMKIMASRYPNVRFKIVESRGDLTSVLKAMQESGIVGLSELSNYEVVPNTPNIVDVLRETRILLVPSLWFESGARIIAEAALSGIPVIASDRGGNKEMVGPGGVIFNLPIEVCEAPYKKLPSEDSLIPLAEKIFEIYDNQDLWNMYSMRALRHAAQNFNMKANTLKLKSFFEGVAKSCL